MNGWAKWISIFLVAIGMIAGHMVFVADGRYFPFREGVELAGGMKSISESLKFNLKAIKKWSKETEVLKDKYYEDKSDRQERKIEEMQRTIRRLESRPRAQ